jgi:hypothetical protein
MSDSELPSWAKTVTPQTPRKVRLSRNWKAFRVPIFLIIFFLAACGAMCVKTLVPFIGEKAVGEIKGFYTESTRHGTSYYVTVSYISKEEGAKWGSAQTSEYSYKTLHPGDSVTIYYLQYTPFIAFQGTNVQLALGLIFPSIFLCIVIYNLFTIYQKRQLLINGRLEEATVTKIMNANKKYEMELSYTWNGKYKTKRIGTRITPTSKFSEVYVLIGEKENQVCIYDENFEWEVVKELF